MQNNENVVPLEIFKGCMCLYFLDIIFAVLNMG
jgi:hypothetical protein